MNIITVRDNLKNLISEKRKYLTSIYDRLDMTCGESDEYREIAEYLEKNIKELAQILADIERCCED